MRQDYNDAQWHKLDLIYTKSRTIEPWRTVLDDELELTLWRIPESLQKQTIINVMELL